VESGKGAVFSSAWWVACLLISTLAAVGLLFDVASAAPMIKVKARVRPIPGFARTGNVYGAGATVDIDFDISGTEFGGVPTTFITTFPRGPAIEPLRGRPRVPGLTLQSSTWRTSGSLSG
jgi:hypothetical protein